MRELDEHLMVGSRLFSNLRWTEVRGGFLQLWRASTGNCWAFSLPAGSEEPEQPAASAIAFKASSSGPGWILPWEEAGRLWTGEKSATSEYIVARKLELPWQVSLETMGTDPLSTACISPAPSLHWGWAGLPRATPCMRIQSMRQARIRPKCFKACSQENHPSQPSHSSTEPWQNQFTGSFSVLVVPISL